MVLFLITLLIIIVTWSVTEFISIWTIGSYFRPVEVLAHAIFAIINIMWIVDLKGQNKDLISEFESLRGFGQILPILLLFMVFLTFVEVLRDMITAREGISYGRRRIKTW